MSTDHRTVTKHRDSQRGCRVWVLFAALAASSVCSVGRAEGWTRSTPRSGGGLACGFDELVAGVRCFGPSCERVSILCKKHGYPWHPEDPFGWGPWFSEESTANGTRISYDGGPHWDWWAGGIECSGTRCDNVRVQWRQVFNTGFHFAHDDCIWTQEISEETNDGLYFPEGFYMSGIHCTGSYCDNLSFYICPIEEP